MKTGGTSIEASLKNYGLQKYGKPKKRNKKHSSLVKHKRAKELISIPEFSESWDDYFKFSFVRNPWDLIVSWYLYDSMGYKKFDNYIMSNGWYEPKYTFKGCFDRICNDKEEIMVDYVGKFESLEKDFKKNM